MLVDVKTNEDFIKQFKKKFEAFCNRSPLFLSYTINPTGCVVTEVGSNTEKRFTFDYSESVFDNISIIKNWLVEEYYPVMIEVDKRTNDLIKWRIEKISIRKNQFLIRNLTSNALNLYKIKMPSIVFFKRFREDKWDEFEAFEVFIKNAEYVRTID